MSYLVAGTSFLPSVLRTLLKMTSLSRSTMSGWIQLCRQCRTSDAMHRRSLWHEHRPVDDERRVHGALRCRILLPCRQQLVDSGARSIAIVTVSLS